MRAAYIPAMMAVTAMPALAEMPAAERERLATCVETRDWKCMFEAAVDHYAKPENVEDCLADTPHGCGFGALGILMFGFGAAEKASPSERRQIAERGLPVLKSISEVGGVGAGDLYFGALRYDACKATGDSACMAGSADLMRIAIAADDDSEGHVKEFTAVLAEEGIRMPLDLAQVIKEVAGMEKLQ